ncbi:MAG TPA: hypothetical protein VHG91_21395 [Longimicrobium sp.]|nr:hypothetical protein [Longimicrobium sp.]
MPVALRPRSSAELLDVAFQFSPPRALKPGAPPVRRIFRGPAPRA